MTVIKDGGSFEPPPPDAPREVSQPLSADAIAQMAERARANEQVLAPFAPNAIAARPLPPSETKLRTPHRPAMSTPAETITGSSEIADVLPDVVPPVALVPALAPALAPIQDHQRAASNTDTPSRGIPQPTLDPGKQVTGGFGEPTDGQYFPLDGAELLVVVERLLDQLRARLQDDLRFSIALTYPRVRARVEVIVDAYATAGGFTVPQVAVPHERTPLEIARAHGEEIVFVVSAQRQEFDADGQPDTAPNAMRIETGQAVPRKQRLEGAMGGAMYADR